MELNINKLLNLACVVIGAIMIGIGSGSALVGLGVGVVGFGLLPTYV